MRRLTNRDLYAIVIIRQYGITANGLQLKGEMPLSICCRRSDD